MKRIWTSLFFSLLIFLSGCAVSRSVKDPVMEQARQKILSGEAQCVLIRNNKIVYQEKGRGVSPLLALYKRQRTAMKDGVIVDKVIGRAAAAIAICGKVRHVHGEVMSEDAAEFLAKYNITSSSTLMVKRILNRKRNGLCPLEQSVLGIDDPYKALPAMEKRIAQLMNQAKKNLKKRK